MIFIIFKILLYLLYLCLHALIVVECCVQFDDHGCVPDIFQFLRSHASKTAPLSMIMEESPVPTRPYKWQRVLLKVSGEALAGDRQENIDPKVCKYLNLEL